MKRNNGGGGGSCAAQDDGRGAIGVCATRLISKNLYSSRSCEPEVSVGRMAHRNYNYNVNIHNNNGVPAA